MDYDKLIEWLRNNRHPRGLKARAATAIETLRVEAEVERAHRIHAEQHADAFMRDCERLNAELARAKTRILDLETAHRTELCENGYGCVELGKVRSNLARVKAERDAAISDLTCIARTYPVELCDDLVCQYCKHYPNINAGCPGWTDNDCFEWCGKKEN